MTRERAMEIAQAATIDAHCRYCHNRGPDAHPAMKCNGDEEDCTAEVRAAVLAAAAEERKAAIAELRAWAKRNTAEADFGDYIDPDSLLAKLDEIEGKT